MSVQPKGLMLTGETNALDYLEKAVRFIHETEKNKLAWKWVVLALHGALYGFAICACKGTNYENVNASKKAGKFRLVILDDALKMCQDSKHMNMLMDSQHLRLSDSQKNSIQKLKEELRNKMEHFMPGVWHIEINGMPDIAIDVLDVIRFLAVDTHTYIHLNQTQQKKVKSCIFQGKRFLKNTRLYHEIHHEVKN